MSQPLDVYRGPGRPPLLAVDAAGDPVGWLGRHRDALRATLLAHGAVVLTGLGLRDDVDAGAALRTLAPGGLLPEREAFAPRQAYPGGVHSATKWPAHQQMCLHHELSYGTWLPGTMVFACVVAPSSGGATVVADAAAVLDALPPDLVARFEREGWRLDRSYNDDIGAPWSEAFGTDDPDAVERYCRDNAIEFAWQPGGGLRTRQRRPAVVRHPVTGVRCWFNQVAFLNEHTLDPEVREFLVEMYGEDALPFTTRFGDGSPVGEDVVALINGVYEQHTLREPWRAGDLLLVDNVRSAHGREAYEGTRSVLVGMADPLHVTQLAPAPSTAPAAAS
jgi:alpha-ketoglutarate-dependent taurine dioxygenase